MNPSSHANGGATRDALVSSNQQLLPERGETPDLYGGINSSAPSSPLFLENVDSPDQILSSFGKFSFLVVCRQLKQFFLGTFNPYILAIFSLLAFVSRNFFFSKIVLAESCDQR